MCDCCTVPQLVYNVHICETEVHKVCRRLKALNVLISHNKSKCIHSCKFCKKNRPEYAFHSTDFHFKYCSVLRYRSVKIGSEENQSVSSTYTMNLLQLHSFHSDRFLFFLVCNVQPLSWDFWSFHPAIEQNKRTDNKRLSRFFFFVTYFCRFWSFLCLFPFEKSKGNLNSNWKNHQEKKSHLI